MRPQLRDDREHGSHIITVLEEAWAAIHTHDPELPRVVMIIGREMDRRWLNWDHFTPGTWSSNTGRTPELFTSGKLIGMGSRGPRSRPAGANTAMPPGACPRLQAP
ncbi:hypothetical protein ACFQ08_19355 [Streptosporangium algeriense]|uniref:Uracil-DNA glycosylase-like domain-containing protein n=1 Tax=Streptosporangium algeriense TaxID=1682748 RepID=A0ABW3DU34_9ACTN